MLEMVVVVAIISIILAMLGFNGYRHARRSAIVAKEAATIKQKLDDAVIRGAIRNLDEYQFYRRQLERQIKSGMDSR